MTWRAIVGLFALNLSFLVVGAALMWALRAWRYWTDLVRLAGVAYLVGLSALVAVLSMELVAGLRFTASSVALTGAVLTVGAVAIGVSRRVAAPSLRAPGWSVPRLTIPRAIALAAIALYVQALFRSSRLSGLSEWDAWWCWTLRAKALFYFEGLDSDLFGQGAPRCPGYPPGFSVVEAMGFHAMGSVDVVTLHLQYWFLAVGFLAAVLGLLAPRVSAEILLPCILLMLVMPSVTSRVTDGRADLPLAYLVVTGALLVVLWLDERNSWQLAVATILFGAALVTKREGVLLVAAVLLAAFVASWADRRSRWWPLVCAGVAAIGLSLAWRIWLLVEGQQSGGPEDGYLGVLDELDRAWPSLWLVLRTVVDYDFWLIAAVLAIVASGLAVLAGVTRAAVFTIAFACAAIAGCWWAIWSQPALPITQDFGANPVVRLVGGPILVLSALAPLLLQQAWDGRTRTINARHCERGGSDSRATVVDCLRDRARGGRRLSSLDADRHLRAPLARRDTGVPKRERVRPARRRRSGQRRHGVHRVVSRGFRTPRKGRARRARRSSRRAGRLRAAAGVGRSRPPPYGRRPGSHRARCRPEADDGRCRRVRASTPARRHRPAGRRDALSPRYSSS